MYTPSQTLVVAAAAPAEPLMVENPYVKGRAAPAQARVEPAPLRIDNPHFVAK